MTKTAAIAFEVRWRKNGDPSDQWSSPASVGADGHVSVPGLERVTDYTFEARAISACGAKSAWATQTFNLPDAPSGTLTLSGLKDEIASASADAAAAVAELANIASDNVLSSAEKPTVMREYSVITSDQAGIDAQATQYGITTQKSDYDTAISTLTAYLNTLNTPTAWNNKSGDTTIVGSSFRTYFGNVYIRRQLLLNAIYAAAQFLANGAQGTAGGGKNAVPNGSFGTNLISTPVGVTLSSHTPVSDGWGIGVIAPGQVCLYEATSAVTDVLIRFQGGNSVPANGLVSSNFQSRKYSCTPGAPFVFNVARSIASNVGLPAGITATLRTYVGWLRGDGSTSATTILDANGNNFAAATSTATGLVPSDATSFFVNCQATLANSNATPTAVGSAGQLPADMRWYGIQLIFGAGDQRELLPVTWAGVRSVLSTSPISYSISGTTVTFSIAAFTLQGGGISISYSAASGSVTQAAGTTVIYYLYFRDATASGGSRTLFIATLPQSLAAFPDIVMLGTATVTVSSGGGGSGGTGGGGGGWCVADDMFISEGLLAGHVNIGDLFDCIDLPRQAGKHVRALQGVTRGYEECVRMITSDGCALVCSISTPFDLPDGRSTTAPLMLGEQVITDLGTATVVSLALVGLRPVTRAHLGGVSYAAGADPKRRIYSHNLNDPSKP